MPGVPLTAYRHSSLIVLWGCNPSASGIHLVPKLEGQIVFGIADIVLDRGREIIGPVRTIGHPRVPSQVA